MPMQATTTTPLFSAALRPDGSLRLAGGWITLGLSALVAAPFMLAIPEIALPTGLAFALIAAGMGVLAWRQSRQKRMTQQVTLWADQLEVVTSDSKGARTLRRFDPHAVRLILERDEDEKVVAMHLRSGKDSLELGAFLKTDDRASFARAFGTALRKARAAR
jgi:uncharacterized membrane protein